MGAFEEDEAMILQKLQEVCEKIAIAFRESHDRLQEEVNTLQTVVALLQTKNGRYKAQLETAYTQLEDEDLRLPSFKLLICKGMMKNLGILMSWKEH